MDDLEWQERANCRSADMELFYSPEEDDIRAALVYCRACAVRSACLRHAMAHRESFGVWGGTTERERRRVFRAERRNRAKQDPTAA